MRRAVLFAAWLLCAACADNGNGNENGNGNGNGPLPEDVPGPETTELPSRVDWRETEGALPPVGDQGSLNSCVAWATCYATSFRMKRFLHASWDLTKASERLSPSYLHNLALQYDQGAGAVTVAKDLHYLDAFGMLTEFGISTAAKMPYTVDFDANATVEAMTQADRLRKELRCLTQWTSLSKPDAGDGEALKRHLVEVGPALLMVAAHSDFGCGIGADYAGPGREATYRGKHSLLCIGYDDEHVRASDGAHAPSFLFMNSWGVSWGTEGCVWIPYEQIRKVTDGGIVYETHVTKVPTLPCPDPPEPEIVFPKEWVDNPSEEVWAAEVYDECGSGFEVDALSDTQSLTIAVTASRVNIRAPAVPLIAAWIAGEVRFVDLTAAADPQSYKLERMGANPKRVGTWEEGARLHILDPAAAPTTFRFRIEVLDSDMETKRVRVLTIQRS